MHVVLAGGGTAGHIEPALALADALRRDDPTVGITALGTQRGLETRLVPERGYRLALVPAVPLPRRPTPDLVKVPGRLAGAVSRVAEILDEVKADVLVGFGGYVAMPAYLAARRRGVPIVVHEANARPGIANRVGARFADFVAVSTPETRLPRARYIGIPLRPAIATLDRAAARVEARDYFGLEVDRATLFVTGGSQGARRLNDAVSEAAPALAAAGVQVLHVTGPNNTVQVSRKPYEPRYLTIPYVDRMDLAYSAADLALCRAGAMTCAEMAAVGLPAVYVPLPIGNGEQRLNATPVVRAGGGLMVDDAHLHAAYIAETVIPLVQDRDRLGQMSAAAARFGRRNADQELVGIIHGAARRRR
jgi:UDP-N-acetylglucosamine--N-acetylmuramyl-(pentapeptide) pyrophosphoryl-undecaprenol N-acetylglucosamine transferase